MSSNSVSENSVSKFGALLTVGNATPILLGKCVIRESYNAGWSCDAYIYNEVDSATDLFDTVVNTNRIEPGKKAKVGAGLIDPSDSNDLNVARTWLCMIDSIDAYKENIDPENPSEGTQAVCKLHLVDPVTYLSSRPIWGAYRSESLGAIIGGALSLAAGGSGMATTAPVLTGFHPINIETNYREALNEIPYVIAVGETLETWLDDIAGRLGVRYEMLGQSEGTVQLTISDSMPDGEGIEIEVVDLEGGIGVGKMHVYDYSYRSSLSSRGYVLDDPRWGEILSLGFSGGVGRLIAEFEVGIDEAAKRANYPIVSSQLEEFQALGKSRELNCRPGRLLRLDVKIGGKDKWQLTNVIHKITQKDYFNELYMVRGDDAWHPMPPPHRSPVLVGATIDAGVAAYERNKPVPRDYLGRIRVHFPFTPLKVEEITDAGSTSTDAESTSTGGDSEFLGYTDTDDDYRLTLADFDKTTIASYTKVLDDNYDAELLESYKVNKTAWETKNTEYEEGQYDDPYGNRPDTSLSETELTNRQTRKQKRDEAKAYNTYKSYQHAKSFDTRDRDDDGVISKRDDLTSNDLNEVLKDDLESEKLKDQWKALKETIDSNEFGRKLFIPLTNAGPNESKTMEFYSVNEATRWDAEVEKLMKGLYIGSSVYSDSRNYDMQMKREKIQRYINYKAFAADNFVENYDPKNNAVITDYLEEKAVHDRGQLVEKYVSEYTHLYDPASQQIYRQKLWNSTEEVPHDYSVPSNILKMLNSDPAAQATKLKELKDSRGLVDADQSAYTYAGIKMFDLDLLKEYGSLFDSSYYDNLHLDNLNAEDAVARLDALSDVRAKAAERELWPPRIPLTIIEPMAGALHGFIPSHRQGDSCRVAVYHPLSAEIVGFQYRDDRKIGSGNIAATTGIVVDHNAGSWSGLVFRQTDEAEINSGVADLAVETIIVERERVLIASGIVEGSTAGSQSASASSHKRTSSASNADDLPDLSGAGKSDSHDPLLDDLERREADSAHYDPPPTDTPTEYYHSDTSDDLPGASTSADNDGTPPEIVGGNSADDDPPPTDTPTDSQGTDTSTEDGNFASQSVGTDNPDEELPSPSPDDSQGTDTDTSTDSQGTGTEEST